MTERVRVRVRGGDGCPHAAALACSTVRAYSTSGGMISGLRPMLLPSFCSPTAGLAGVGIFFQQDSETNEVFVKTIVKGGSAVCACASACACTACAQEARALKRSTRQDRSGVLRVGDVVVRVDHENVEGQPLSTLRSQILGGQGTYVTLGFRRREGPETTFYDVPLMR